MLDVDELIAADLGVTQHWLHSVVSNAPDNYKAIPIPKRSGGVRIICQPAIETKMLQLWLLTKVFSTLPVSKIATAFEKGSSTLKNALIHQHHPFSVRVDIANFFPSLSFADLKPLLEKNTACLPTWTRTPRMLEIIERTCFSKNGRLPIGYVTSPRIANVMMNELDLKLVARVESKRHDFGSCALSRYADDIVFSSDVRGACGAFVTEIRRVFHDCESPRLHLNIKKTRLMNRRAGSTLITGLRVKPTGDVGVTAQYRDQVRLMLKLHSKSSLREEDIPILRGHLAYIQHVDPALFTKLCFRFHKEIEALGRAYSASAPQLRLVA